MTIFAIVLAVLAANVLVLMFMAGAKRLSYTPAEIAADYEEQYQWLLKHAAKRDDDLPPNGNLNFGA
jgi:hypothetical protein